MRVCKSDLGAGEVTHEWNLRGIVGSGVSDDSETESESESEGE